MFKHRVFEELLEAMASDAMSPGSGAAAASALALGIACLRKAVAISAKHDADNVDLQEAATRLCGLSDRAMAAADADVIGFPRLASEQRSKAERADSADDLAALGERLTQLCAQLAQEADMIAPHIRPAMANDLLAARRLGEAAAAIAKANGAENAAQAAN